MKDFSMTCLTLVDKTKRLSLQRKLHDESIGHVQCMQEFYLQNLGKLTER